MPENRTEWERATARALERERELSRGPVTRDELAAREKQRAAPVHEAHLRPGGAVEQIVHRNLDADNERRIGFIRRRLASAQAKVRDDFRRAR